MANEIANRAHAGLVLQMFEDPQLAPIIVAAWGVDVATLQKVETGTYVARLTQPLGLTLDATDPTAARFNFIVTAQGIALPNFATGFVIPDPFVPAVGPFGPGDSIPFPWLAMQTVEISSAAIDADGIVNFEVRRVPGERRR